VVGHQADGTSPVTQVGDLAPDFTLRNQHGQDVTLSSFRGEKNVVLMFFPFAFSGICAGELTEVRDNLADLEGYGAEVLAVSCDHMFSNRAFADRDDYSFSLLSDFWPHGAVARAYGIFEAEAGVALRGTYVIDRARIVRWKVEHGIGEARDLVACRTALQEIA
jgi:peroxiredoxin